jgi:predicted amidophosphoribosyltransferase
MLAKLIGLVVPPLCAACGADAGRAGPLCRECRAQLQGPVPFPYEGPAGALVRALKFGGRVAIADVMAGQIAARVQIEGSIVPVPVHPSHRRRRGVDHTAALARALARRTGVPSAACLVRAGDPRPQAGRGRAARVQGPPGQVRVTATPPATVVLVDDVVTTGATLAASIAALRDSGSRQIAPIVYARTTGR